MIIIIIDYFSLVCLFFYLIPLNTLFPRLNALSLWLVFNSLIIMFLSMFIDGGVNAGWTS